MKSVHEDVFLYALGQEHARMTRNLPRLTAVLLAIVRHENRPPTASIAELDAGGENTCEMSLHVHEVDQRQGIGKNLVEAALQEARLRGFGRAVVHVWQENGGMLSILRKAGFHRTASGNGEIVMVMDLGSAAPARGAAFTPANLPRVRARCIVR